MIDEGGRLCMMADVWCMMDDGGWMDDEGEDGGADDVDDDDDDDADVEFDDGGKGFFTTLKSDRFRTVVGFFICGI